MLPLGTVAPEFDLPDATGTRHSLKAIDQKAVLVVFLCNHCPFVQHVKDELAALSRDVRSKGVAMIGINSNDVQAYPDDAPAKMLEVAKANGWLFPYLIDEDQSVAKAYRAACTPDFFLFDKERKLVYRGQLDDSRPGNNVAVSGGDLRAAIKAVATGRPVSDKQKPSIGCNIKWKPGNAPEYFQPEAPATPST
jgi:peroxiredoxin